MRHFSACNACCRRFHARGKSANGYPKRRVVRPEVTAFDWLKSVPHLQRRESWCHVCDVRVDGCPLVLFEDSEDSVPVLFLCLLFPVDSSVPVVRLTRQHLQLCLNDFLLAYSCCIRSAILRPLVVANASPSFPHKQAPPTHNKPARLSHLDSTLPPDSQLVRFNRAWNAILKEDFILDNTLIWNLSPFLCIEYRQSAIPTWPPLRRISHKGMIHL